MFSGISIEGRARGDWKARLACIRSFACGTAVTSTVIASFHAELWQALFIGTLAATWSAAMQYGNRPYLAWLTGRDWFRIDSEYSGSMRRAFAKKAATTATYALMMTLGFWLTELQDLDRHSLRRMAMMVAESLFTQTYWQTLNQQWTQAAIARRPDQAWYYARLSGVGSLVQSVLNVTSNVLNIGGSLAGTALALTVGTSGMIVYYAAELGLQSHLDRALRRRIAS